MRKTVLQRIMSVFVALALLFTYFPASLLRVDAAVFNKKKYTLEDTADIEYIINKVENETSSYIAERLRLLIYGDKTSNQYPVGASFPSRSSYQTLTDNETGESIAVKSAQCFAYAEWAFYKYFGTAKWNGGGYVNTDENVKITASNVKEALSDVKCGAHFRFADSISGYQHSVSFVTNDEAGNGFYFLEANGDSSGYEVYLCYATYEDFASVYSGKKINFIQHPAEYPECNDNSQLTVSTAKIPVNVKTGRAADIMGTTVMSNCKITSITAGVYTSSGTEKFTASVTPNCNAFRFGKIHDLQMFEFSSLSAGDYVYKLYAEDESGATVRIERDFTVSSAETAYTTETFYSYAVTKYDTPLYFSANENVMVYNIPDAENGVASPLKENTVVMATGYHEGEDGTVWLFLGPEKWVKQSDFTEHTHDFTETGLCKSEGCDYDETQKPEKIVPLYLVALDDITGMSRPYNTESDVLSLVTENTLVEATAMVENLAGEIWYETKYGFLSSNDLDSVKSISIVNLPKKTVYYVDEKLDSDGFTILVTLSEGKSYETEKNIDFSYSFVAAGESKVKAEYGDKEISFTVTVLPTAGKETWKVDTDEGSNLNVRSSPSTSATKTTQYENGRVFTVSEITVSGGYTWGKTPDGYVALDYCRYQSGYLYEIKYNLNGGEGNVPSTFKASPLNSQITSVIPVRRNHTFIGWAKSATATEADYISGGTYKENKSVTLYAVWKSGNNISGEISITGTPAYGNPLTLNVSGILPENAEYSIVWLRDGIVIPNATSATYEIVAEDIGKMISAQVTGTGDFGGGVTSNSVTATKKSGSAVSVPVLKSSTYSSLTFEKVNGAEYSIDGGVKWQVSNEFTGLNENTSYTVSIRMAETSVSLAGEASSKTFVTPKKIPTSVTSQKYSVNNTDRLISKIPLNTKVSDFISGFSEAEFVTVFDTTGKKVENDSLIGTGMTVKVGDGTTFTVEYTVCVTGDINGDGKTNVTDMVAVKAHILETQTLSGIGFKGADTNGDGKVNVTDFVNIKAYILDKSDIQPI